MRKIGSWPITIAALFLAFLTYSLLGAVDPALVTLINPFVVLVFSVAMLYGETAGLLMGTAAGLLQDAFSYGVFGLAGLSFIMSGFLMGWFSQKLDLNSFSKRFLFVFIFSILQLSIWVILYALIFKKSLLYTQPFIYLQPATTSLLVSGLVWLFRKWQLKGDVG
ncbi:MAG: rod shape-determining protein MreD [Candidatus Aminicenantes bacterium]|nr:rod shape-determining protein MreD [Candidatus Aminicenantes bacterium]